MFVLAAAFQAVGVSLACDQVGQCVTVGGDGGGVVGGASEV